MLEELDVDVHTDSLTGAYIRDHMRAMMNQKKPAELVFFGSEMLTAINETSLKEGILQTLTNLWDCHTRQDLGSTSGKGRIVIKNVWFSMLLCSTREWLITGLRRDQLGGGFAARLVIMWGDAPHTQMEYSPYAPSGARECRQRCIEHMRMVQHLSGAMTLDPGAVDVWEQYRRKLLEERETIDPRVEAFCGRGHTHLLKFAALESLSNRLDMHITESDMFSATVMFEDLRPLMEKALQGLARTEYSASMDMVKQFISKAGGQLTKGELTRKLHQARRNIPPHELDEIIRSLIAIGDITYTPESLAGGKQFAQLIKETPRADTHDDNDDAEDDPTDEHDSAPAHAAAPRFASLVRRDRAE